MGYAESMHEKNLALEGLLLVAPSYEIFKWALVSFDQLHREYTVHHCLIETALDFEYTACL